jgi:hypothetical protein
MDTGYDHLKCGGTVNIRSRQTTENRPGIKIRKTAVIAICTSTIQRSYIDLFGSLLEMYICFPDIFEVILVFIPPFQTPQPHSFLVDRD